MRKQHRVGQIGLNLFFVITCACYLLPLLLIISVSFSDEESIALGFSLIPRAFSLDAYRLAFRNPQQLLNSYKVTILFTVIGCALSTFIMCLMAYALSRPTYKFRNFFSFMAFFTMLFSGGLVPSYILNTRYLHLNNTLWIYILPSVMSAWNLIVLRTNFQKIPLALIESAKIDGASEYYICFRIVFPLSVPAIATIAFFYFVGKWNDWNTAVIYIQDTKLYSLQYLLQRILREAEFMEQMVKEQSMEASEVKLPTESFRFAMALLAAGPVLAVFPFFQKYFSKGLTVGSVKG